MIKTYYAVYARGAELPWLLSYDDPRQQPILMPIMEHFGDLMTVKQIRIELNVQEHSKKNETRDAILSLFNSGRSIPTWDIIESLDLPPGSVRQTLSKLVARGELVRVRNGVYRRP